MKGCFSKVKLLQGKPDRMEECEALIPAVAQARRRQPGCMDVKDVKLVFTIDGVEAGQPPRGLTKIMKCVKWFSCWAFDNKESCRKGIQWFFNQHGKEIQRLLLMPFAVHCGNSLC